MKGDFKFLLYISSIIMFQIFFTLDIVRKRLYSVVVSKIMQTYANLIQLTKLISVFRNDVLFCYLIVQL